MGVRAVRGHEGGEGPLPAIVLTGNESQHLCHITMSSSTFQLCILLALSEGLWQNGCACGERRERLLNYQGDIQRLHEYGFDGIQVPCALALYPSALCSSSVSNEPERRSA